MQSNRSIIGVVGGMGPLSTIRFYEQVVEICHRNGLRGNDEYPHLILSNLPVPDLINDMERAELTQQMIVDELQRFEAAGCHVLAIACNTVHLYFDRFRAAVNIPLLHIVEETVAELRRRGARNVLILGTPTTIRQGLYDTAVSSMGAKAVVPSADEQKFLGDLIPKLVGGAQTPGEVERLQTMIDSHVAGGGDAVVLACTELGVALSERYSDLLVEPLAVLAEKVTALGTASSITS